MGVFLLCKMYADNKSTFILNKTPLEPQDVDVNVSRFIQDLKDSTKTPIFTSIDNDTHNVYLVTNRVSKGWIWNSTKMSKTLLCTISLIDYRPSEESTTTSTGSQTRACPGADSISQECQTDPDSTEEYQPLTHNWPRTFAFPGAFHQVPRPIWRRSFTLNSDCD